MSSAGLLGACHQYLAPQRDRFLVARDRGVLPAAAPTARAARPVPGPFTVAFGLSAPDSSTCTPVVVRRSSHDRCGVTTLTVRLPAGVTSSADSSGQFVVPYCTKAISGSSMPSAARSAGIAASGSPSASSASARWTTVSWASRRIQKPTLWSGLYQVYACSSGRRAANLLVRAAQARSSSSSRARRSSPRAATGRGRYHPHALGFAQVDLTEMVEEIGHGPPPAAGDPPRRDRRRPPARRAGGSRRRGSCAVVGLRASSAAIRQRWSPRITPNSGRCLNACLYTHWHAHQDERRLKAVMVAG